MTASPDFGLRRAPAGGTFAWRGEELEYLDHQYNTTAWNERCVEVPIVNAWFGKHELMDADVLEVGNVMSHYGWSGHDVVDLHERAPGVQNVDAREPLGCGAYDRIVSISTLEHVGWDPGRDDPRGSVRALVRMRDALRPEGRLLVTTPFGQNPWLDCMILDGAGPFKIADASTMLRSEETGEWLEVEGAAWASARELGWARAVWVAEWTR